MDPWMWSLGLMVLVLTVLFTALCSHCGRRSFELRDTTQEKRPSTLVRVVKLDEEARENPFVEKSKDGQENVHVTPWRSHLGAPQVQDSSSEDSPGTVPLWRSHLGAPLNAGP